MSKKNSMEPQKKNYKANLIIRIEENINSIVEKLVTERDQLKQKVNAQNAKIADFEREQIQRAAVLAQRATLIEILEDQVRRADEIIHTNNCFTRGIFDIARNLSPAFAQDYPNGNTLMAVSKAITNRPANIESLNASSHSSEQNELTIDEDALLDDGGNMNNEMANENIDELNQSREMVISGVINL